MAPWPSRCPLCLNLHRACNMPGSTLPGGDCPAWPLELSLPHVCLRVCPPPPRTPHPLAVPRSSVCPHSSSLSGWCCHSAITPSSLCFLDSCPLSEADQDTRGLDLFMLHKTSMQKAFSQNTFPPLLQWPEKNLGIKNSACLAPTLSSALDNQEPVVIAVANSTKVGWCESPGLRGSRGC